LSTINSFTGLHTVVLYIPVTPWNVHCRHGIKLSNKNTKLWQQGEGIVPRPHFYTRSRINQQYVVDSDFHPIGIKPKGAGESIFCLIYPPPPQTNSNQRNLLGLQADTRRSSAMKILIFIFGEYCLALTACRNWDLL
jgi:hypothetical protein